LKEIFRILISWVVTIVYRFHCSLKSDSYGTLYDDVTELMQQFIGKIPKYVSEKNVSKDSWRKIRVYFIAYTQFYSRQLIRTGFVLGCRWGARFSASVQTCPEAHPAFYTMGTGSFLGAKRPGRGVDHPPHLAPRLKKE